LAKHSGEKLIVARFSRTIFGGLPVPGRLRSSFRSGNLAEHLGLLLLKGIAAVADVSRTEDVGFDAVASLLRRDEDGNCYAEDSFVVQLKSESATSLEYRDHELIWLLGQSQPMFIGLVSLRDSRISLYSTLYANQAVLALHAKQVTIRFGVSGLPPFLGNNLAWAGGPNHSATVWLGEPVLEWTLANLPDPEWSISAYEIMKRFLRIARREYELLAFGQCSQLGWAKNDRESIRSFHMIMMKGHTDDIHALARRCMPGLQALMMHSIAMPDQTGNSMMIPLIELAAAMRELGADIDPDSLFAKSFVALRSQLETCLNAT
jgi:hypothetical protein